MRIAICNKVVNQVISEDDERRIKEVISLFLEHGADINMANAGEDLSAATALHFACCNSYPSIIKFLIQHGANPHVLDANGCTPFFYSSRFGNTCAMKALLECEVDVNLKDTFGDTPIIDTSKYGYPITNLEDVTSSIKILLENGARVNDQSDNGATPLSIAVQKTQECSNEELALIRLLLDSNADVNIALTKDIKLSYYMWAVVEDTPMHVAVKKTSIPLVKLLLEYHPKINCWNSENETPLDVAKGLKHAEITHMI